MTLPRLVPPPPDVPEIRIGPDLERMSNEAVAAISRDGRVYQRAGALCWVVSIPEGPYPGAVRRPGGSPVIRSLLPPSVRERLSACARWLKYDGRSKDHRPCLPPDSVVSSVMSRGEWGGVRSLASVATSPCLRPDGTVLQAPGYDPQSHTLYWPRGTYIQVSDAPTQEDARGALDAISSIVSDFPFALPQHRSAWIAGALTLFARPAIAGPCPLFAVDATTRGTGKSRLVDAAVRLATGLNAARTSLPEDDDEMRKRITSIVLEGDAAVCIDNVTRPIAMPSLDAVLTGVEWQDRLLGSNTSVKAPARAIWWATGNNLVLGGDLSRRTLHVRLESPLENPEERVGFEHPDLLRWIDSQRPRLVASALTILRAYTLAGRPDQGTRVWGSYEDWSALIPPAIVWAGGADPMGARATHSDVADQEQDNLMVIMDGIRRAFGANAMSAKDMVAELYVHRAKDTGLDDLRSGVEEVTRCQSGKIPEHPRLAYYLRRIRGRVVNGRRLERADTQNHLARWAVRDVAPGTSQTSLE